jgi:hypothetical protein
MSGDIAAGEQAFQAMLGMKKLEGPWKPHLPERSEGARHE